MNCFDGLPLLPSSIIQLGGEEYFGGGYYRKDRAKSSISGEIRLTNMPSGVAGNGSRPHDASTVIAEM